MAKFGMIDRSAEVKALLERNKKAALEKMGAKATELILDRMESGYGRPIRQTGELMRDLGVEAERSGKDTVDVGNSLAYALIVHEGTRKIPCRPYIKDAIQGGRGELKQAAEGELKKGFEKG